MKRHQHTKKRISLRPFKLRLASQLVLFSLIAVVITYWFLVSPNLEAPSQPEMPDFTPQLEAMKDYYKFHFFPDGYPGRYDDGKVVEHPLYGVYVLGDYISQYHDHPTDSLREAIYMVSNAAISRMKEYNHSIVFWYPADQSVTRAYKRYYSGLTPSYYTLRLFSAFQITGETSFKEASEKAFRSLLIPDEEGGVLYSWEDGVSIAEVPMQPNGLILNGWLSILVNLHRYGQLTGSIQSQELFAENAQTLAKLLPLYDAEEYRNSRYNLAGFQYLKLHFSDVSSIVIRDLKLEVPNEGIFDIPIENASSRWEYWVFKKDARNSSEGISVNGKVLRMNLVLSRLSFPQENVLYMTLDSTRELEMDVYLHVGIYDPLSTSQTQNEWKYVTTYKIKPGSDHIAIALPWELCELTAYPTNFKKKIRGRRYNVYHFIHIDQLKRLYQITGIETFQTYADKWQGYIEDWPAMQMYRNLEHGRHR